jgi:hypothetical protein
MKQLALYWKEIIYILVILTCARILHPVNDIEANDKRHIRVEKISNVMTIIAFTIEASCDKENAATLEPEEIRASGRRVTNEMMILKL